MLKKLLLYYSIILFLFFTFPFSCNATDVIDDYHMDWVNLVLPTPTFTIAGQMFVPLQNNISKIVLWNGGNSATTTEFSLCKGTPDVQNQTDWETNAFTCGYTDNVVVYHNADMSVNAEAGYNEITFDTPISLVQTEQYYFVWRLNPNSIDWSAKYNTTELGGLVNDNGTTMSFVFQEYYDDDYIYYPDGIPDAIFNLGIPNDGSTVPENENIPFTGSYESATQYDYLFIEIHNLDKDYLTFETLTSTTTTGSFSTTKTVEDGNYNWTAWLQTSPEIKSNEATPNFFSVGTSTIPTDLDFTDEDFGLLGNYFRDVIVWAFYPSQTSLNSFLGVRDDLMLKAPFGYYTEAKSIFSDITVFSGDTPSLDVDIDFGNGDEPFAVLSFSGLETMIGSGSMTMLRNLMKYALYIFLLFYFYIRITSIFKSNQ